MGDLNWLRWFTGIGWGTMGGLLLFLQITTPQLFENYHAPTAGLIDKNEINQSQTV